MKINLSDAFDELDLENTERIPSESLTSDYNNEITERVKYTVFSNLDIQSEKKKISATRRIGRFVAIAAVIAILASCISVGATVYFKPDSRIAEYLTYSDDVDMNTLGQDVNVKQSYGDYELTLVQVLSDNSTMQLLFESKQLGDLTPYPEEIQAKVNGNWYNDSVGILTRINDDGYCYSTIDGLRNIKTGDNIEIFVTSIGLYNAKQDEFDENSHNTVNMSFAFDANRTNVKQHIDVPNFVLDDEEYIVKNCVISPLGFYFDFKSNADTASNIELINSQIDLTSDGKSSIVVEMKDGTIYSDNFDEYHINVSIGSTSHFLGGGIKGHYDAVFDTVIQVEEIKSITVSGNVLYQA